MVTRTRPDVTVYEHCMAYYIQKEQTVGCGHTEGYQT
jgi:hypothetical protein